MKQPADNPGACHADYVHASGRQCPLCQGYLIRTPRRAVDRLFSLFKPVLRYRCQRFSCQWNGNLSRREADQPAQGESARAAAQGRVSLAFTIQMVFAVVGTILVILVGTTEPSVWREVLWMDPVESQETDTSVAQDATPGLPALRAVGGPDAADGGVLQATKN